MDNPDFREFADKVRLGERPLGDSLAATAPAAAGLIQQL